MNIPEQVKNEARVLIEQYGDTFEYLGIYEGQEAYVFKFPGDSCTGYPFVYLYDGKDATEITGPLSLDVIDSCIENIEEGDIDYLIVNSQDSPAVVGSRSSYFT